MINDKINSITIFIFALFFSLVGIIYYLIPNLLDSYKNNAWIYVLFAFLVIILPQGAKFNYRVGVYALLSLLLNISFMLIILDGFIFIDESLPKLLFPLLLSIILLERNGAPTIFNVSTIFYLIGIIIAFLPLFVNQKIIDYSLVLPFNLRIEKIHLLFPILIIPIDMKILYCYKDMFSNTFKGRYPLAITILYLMFLLFVTVSIYGYPFLKTCTFPSLMLFETQSFSLFGQLDFMMLYILLTTTVFSSALRLNIMRISFSIKRRKACSIAFFLSLFISIIVVCRYFFLVDYIFYLSLGVGLLIYGGKNARNITKTIQ